MRVLIVVTSTVRRGAEIEGSQLAGELRDLGIEADAVALTEGPGDRQLDLPVLGHRAFAPSTLRALRRAASGRDVVVAYGSTTLPACALALAGSRVPFVYRSIGDPASWVRGRRHRWRTSRLLHRAAHVVALWPGAADVFRTLYGIDGVRVSIIPNARSPVRPPANVDRSSARACLGLASADRVVGCIGALTSEKRVDRAIGAVAELASTHLLIVGDGPERATLVAQGRRLLGDRVTFTGSLDDVGPIYAAIDLLLITSRTEGMPGVMLEAAGAGVPTVATDVGALGWMRVHGLPVTVIPREATCRTIATAIEDVSTPSSDHIDLSSFEWPSVAARWEATLRRVTSR